MVYSHNGFQLLVKIQIEKLKNNSKMKQIIANHNFKD